MIGIDFGNHKCCVSILEEYKINILCDETSNGLIPTMVAYSNSVRHFGNFAKHQQQANEMNTLNHLKRLIGLKYNSSERGELEDLITYKLTDSCSNIEVQVEYRNDIVFFRIEQCLGYFFKELFKIAELHEIKANECVIVVPPFWNEKQRRIIIDAVQISGYPPPKLLDSTTAQVLTYHYYRKELLEQNNVTYVAFIDFGDSCLNCSVAKYTRNHMVEIVGNCCVDHMGGSKFTLALANYLLQMIKIKYNVNNPLKDCGAKVRFLNAVEELKKKLSVNSKINFEIFSLSNDLDVNIVVQRSDFEMQIQNLLDQIHIPINEAIKLAHITKENIFAIELHGGTSRIPAVKRKIADIFGGRQPTQVVNSDEYLAIGASHYAAILNPDYPIHIEMKNMFYHNIEISYLIQGNFHTFEVFPLFQTLPSKKRITLEMYKQLNIKVFYDHEEIGIIDIRSTHSKEKITVNMYMSLTVDGILQINEISKCIDSLTKVKQINEMKKNIPFRYQLNYGLDQQNIKIYKGLEEIMQEMDSFEKEIDNAKNELESYINCITYDIQNDYQEYYDLSKINEYNQIINDIKEWFAEFESERLSKSEYDSKLQVLKAIREPVLENYMNRERINSSLNNLKCRIARSFETLEYIKYENQIYKAIYNELENMRQSIIDEEDMIMTYPKHVSIDFFDDYYNSRILCIERKIDKLINQ